MPKAIPGLPYTVLPGDTLVGIAKQAYGDPRKWRTIWKANKNNARTDDPNNSFYPGDIINIPKDETKEQALNDLIGPDIPKLIDKDEDDFTLVIEDTEIPVLAGRAWRAIDSVSYGWSATVYFNPDNDDIYELFKPYRYRRAQCYLGGLLICDGICYVTEIQIGDNGSFAVLEGASYTANLIDSTVRPPYEANNVTLNDRINDLVAPFSIPVNILDTVDPDLLSNPFKRVTIGPEDKIFDHLSQLAFQRSVLLTTNELGELVVTTANTKTRPVGTIEEGLPPFIGGNIRFDGRNRFNVYKGIGTSPGRKKKTNKNSKTAVAKDEVVTQPRFLTFNVDNTEVGDIQRSVDWQRSKQVADSLTLSVPVSSWYGPNKALWAPNTKVTLISKTFYIPDGFTFLIRSIEYIFEDKGTTANLDLVPPQVYTGEQITEPWGIPEKGFLESLL